MQEFLEIKSLTAKSDRERADEWQTRAWVAIVIAAVGWTILALLLCQFVFDQPK